MTALSGAGLSEAKIQNGHQGHPGGWWGPNHLDHLLLPFTSPKAGVARTDESPHGMPALQTVVLRAIPQCWLFVSYILLNLFIAAFGFFKICLLLLFLAKFSWLDLQSNCAQLAKAGVFVLLFILEECGVSYGFFMNDFFHIKHVLYSEVVNFFFYHEMVSYFLKYIFVPSEMITYFFPFIRMAYPTD